MTANSNIEQWGGMYPGGEAMLDGVEWRQFPSRALRVRPDAVTVERRSMCIQ